ncbi:MAG: glycosyltransferase family 1 protein [Thermoprotei archaeon]|nr:MAG: glycosyltransferase family 1 protein [Thermoprotei archaeon]
MIILHAFHNYYPFLGGMERAVQGLAEAQAKLGHEVHVITSTYGAQQRPAEEVLNNVYIHRVKARRFHYPDLTIPRIIPVEVMKKADIVHVHGHNSLFSMKMLNEAFKLRVKTACYFMAVDAFRDHPNMFIRLLGPYYGRRNTRRALGIVDLPLVKSIRDLEILKKTYGVDAEYLPDAIPDYYFTTKKGDPDEFQEKFGIKQEKIFLFIGRMHRLKGPHILVKALKYVEEDIAAVFIGPDDGYLKETLDLAKRLGVRDRVHMLGFVDEETKMHAIDSAVALVLPSVADYVEVYPMVISEAWVREKPVIASKVGGVPYRVKHGINGMLVNPSDPKGLAETMLEVAHDDKLAKEMGRNGRKDVFSWREIAVKSIQLYMQILEDK